jgi:glutathione-regulated potassium-efflux system protein KefB
MCLNGTKHQDEQGYDHSDNPRAFDKFADCYHKEGDNRRDARQLVAAGVDFQIRETFESALQAGGAALRLLEVSEAEIADILASIRERDAERFALEIAGGGYEAGIGMLLRNTAQTPSRPTPFSKPRAAGKVLNEVPAGAATGNPT